MFSWKQVSIFKSFQKLVFFDEYGFGIIPNPKYNNIEFHTEKGKTYYLDELYIQVGKKYFRLDSMVEKIGEHVFKEQLFISKSVTSPIFAPINIVSVKVSNFFYTINDYENIQVTPKNWPKKPIEFSFRNEEELSNFKVWVFEGGSLADAFKRPCFGEKHQNQYYLLGNGVVSVSKTFTYENDDTPLMEVKTNDGGNIVIEQGNKNLVSRPSTYHLVDHNEELKFLDNNLNIETLDPFVEISEDGILFAWKKNDDVGKHYVELYRLKSSKFGHKLYQFAVIEMEDKQYYTISADELKLLGSPVIVRVVIKNKEGDITAFTNGYYVK